MAGVPFDTLEKLGTTKSSSLARELLALREERKEHAAEAERFFASRERLLERAAYNALRVAVRAQRAPAVVGGEQPPVFSNYARAAAAVEEKERQLATVLRRELQLARASLIRSAGTFISDYLLFAAETVSSALLKDIAEYPADLAALPERHNAARKVEQSLWLYLQRVAAKNDTFSRFGPSAWGRTSEEVRGMSVRLEPGIAARETFLERWTAHTVARAINADIEAFLEISPRLNPRGSLEGDVFVSVGEPVALTADELLLVRKCNGRKPVHALTGDPQQIQQLVAKGVLRCEIEVPALEPHAFEVLREDVASWRPNSTRARWLDILTATIAAADKLRDADLDQRRRLISETRACLQSIGSAPQAGQRFLYAAHNPIGEECFRNGEAVIGSDLIDQVAREAEPWIDLWRDSYAFVASRVAAGLRQIFAKVSGGKEAIPLPVFLHACGEARLSLTGPGLVALAVIAFQEVKAAFIERLKPHSACAEYELTLDDCRIVRSHFEFPRFDEYTYPSADLQLSARSMEDIARGDFTWVIGELHPAVALLHHGFYWSCPEKAALNSALTKTACGKPTFHFGFFAADFTSHTCMRLFDAMPDLANFVAPERANPDWRQTSPADAEVYVDASSGDVCVRRRDNREHLGSFARAWVIPLGFHPFQFGFAPHTPRLRCGNVVVQRRSWTVTVDEFSSETYAGISPALVVAVEALRAARDVPRYIYIRPTEQALRRSGAEGRDKDTKPVFIDLESYLSIEIFYRWLQKAGELEVTEMLPDPDHLCWQEEDGRRTFELRTLIVPRS